jgi:hypothetical protein
VAQGDIHRGLGLEGFVADEIAAFDFLAGLDVDDGDSDVVVGGIVDEKLDHLLAPFKIVIGPLSLVTTPGLF